MNKTCIIIAGPTASGKTGIALGLAKHFSTHILSSDSRQCYKELDIGVAKPTAEQLSSIPHHFINTHSISEPVSAADFESYSLHTADLIFESRDVLIMAGGTGLYIKAFAEGLDPVQPVDPCIREKIIVDYKEKGIDWLREQLRLTDPVFYEQGEMQNPQRMMRALEVIRSTGTSITSFHSGKKKERHFDIIKICLELPRNELYHRINERVNEMMEMGLLDEVKRLLPYKNSVALQTVGYTELFSYLDGEISLSRAVELIKQNSRHYAKRQLTWFKKDPEFRWLPPDKEKIMEFLNERIS